MKKFFIAILCIFTLTTIFTTTYAWFIAKSNVGYIVATDINLNVDGYYITTNTNGEATEDKWKSLNDKSNPISIQFDNIIHFAFVVTNNSDTSVDMNIKLSDFSSYIFDSIENHTDDYGVSTNDKDSITKYNSKFFLAIDSLTIKNCANSYSPTLEEKSTDLTTLDIYEDTTYTYSDSTYFLWKYSYRNQILKDNVSISKGQSKIIYLTLKNNQSAISLQNDYPAWLKAKGATYVEANYDNKYDSTNIETYFTNYYYAEKETLYEDSADVGTTLKDTTICIDYFEFTCDI